LIQKTQDESYINWSKVKDWPYHFWFSKKKWYEIVELFNATEVTEKSSGQCIIDLERL